MKYFFSYSKKKLLGKFRMQSKIRNDHWNRNHRKKCTDKKKLKIHWNNIVFDVLFERNCKRSNYIANFLFAFMAIDSCISVFEILIFFPCPHTFHFRDVKIKQKKKLKKTIWDLIQFVFQSFLLFRWINSGFEFYCPDFFFFSFVFIPNKFLLFKKKNLFQ